MLKLAAYNTASAGSKNDIEVAVHYRNQWAGLNNRTLSTASLEFLYPIIKINSAITFNSIVDIIGVQRNVYLNAGYSYQLKIKKAKLGIGISGGIVQTTLLGNLLRAPEGDYDGVFTHNDPIIPLTKKSGVSPYLNASLFFSNKNLMLGCSLTNALEGKANAGSPNSSKNIIFRRNIYGFVSYNFEIRKNFTLQPNLLFRTDLKKMQFDYTLLLGIRNKYTIGLGYRGYNKKSNESVILLLGLKIIKNLKIMYSYDISTSRLFNYQYGSHEVTLQYAFVQKIKSIVPKTTYNPRFL